MHPGAIVRIQIEVKLAGQPSQVAVLEQLEGRNNRDLNKVSGTSFWGNTKPGEKWLLSAVIQRPARSARSAGVAVELLEGSMIWDDELETPAISVSIKSRP